MFCSSVQFLILHVGEGAPVIVIHSSVKCSVFGWSTHVWGFVPTDWENCTALTLEESLKLWYLTQNLIKSKRGFTSSNNDPLCFCVRMRTQSVEVGVEGEESAAVIQLRSEAFSDHNGGRLPMFYFNRR